MFDCLANEVMNLLYFGSSQSLARTTNWAFCLSIAFPVSLRPLTTPKIRRRLEIEKKTADLYQKKDGVFSCLACNYTWSGRNGTWTMKRHIEVHLDGLSYQCSFCNKEFRSKSSLMTHKSNVKCSKYHFKDSK